MTTKPRDILKNLHRNENGFIALETAALVCIGAIVIGGLVKIGTVVAPPAYNLICDMCNTARERLKGKMGVYTPDNYNDTTNTTTSDPPTNPNGEIEIQVSPCQQKVTVIEDPAH